MKARIATELRRSNLTAEISSAVQDAIKFYQAKPLHFKTDSFNNAFISTIAGVFGYGVDLANATQAFSDTLANIYEVEYQRDNTATLKYPLERITLERYRELDVNALYVGWPTYFTVFKNELWVWPRPDNNTAFLRVIGMTGLTAPVSDSDTTVWTTECETLVRCHAKGLLYEHVIRSPADADRMKGQEQIELQNLRADYTRGASSRRVKHTEF